MVGVEIKAHLNCWVNISPADRQAMVWISYTNLPQSVESHSHPVSPRDIEILMASGKFSALDMPQHLFSPSKDSVNSAWSYHALQSPIDYSEFK